ncbi:MHS family MFS transporter [Pseudonocardia sp. MCCB 268]|nr:MHS family MFS transporter [Pseudonocardia cytotoxica]
MSRVRCARATGQTPRKAALASFTLSSLVEYYDFFIYGSASALVFQPVLAQRRRRPSGTLETSLATFAVYVARPIGSFFLGHFGDRIQAQARPDLHPRIDGRLDVPHRLPARLLLDRHLGADPASKVLFRVAQDLSAAGEQAVQFDDP